MLNLGNLLGGKLRLFVEYALVAGLLAVGGWAFALYLQRGSLRKDVESQTLQISTLTRINVSQDQALKLIQAHRDRDNKLVERLINDLEGLGTVDKEVRRRLTDLENTDAVVHDYLADSVPPQLSCLFSDACRNGAGASRSSGAATGGTSDTLHHPSR